MNKELEKALGNIYADKKKEVIDTLYWDDLLDKTTEFLEKNKDWNTKQLLKKYEQDMDKYRNMIIQCWYNKDIGKVLEWIIEYMIATIWYMYFWNQDKDKILWVMKGILGMTMLPEDLLRLAFLEILSAKANNREPNIDKVFTYLN